MLGAMERRPIYLLVIAAIWLILAAVWYFGPQHHVLNAVLSSIAGAAFAAGALFSFLKRRGRPHA